MAGIIGVGEDGRHVTPYDSWLDTRCSPWIESHAAGSGRGDRAEGRRPSQLQPRAQDPVVEARAARRPTSASAPLCSRAATRPCGCAAWTARRAFIDTSYLHFSGFADSRAATWDPASAGASASTRRCCPASSRPTRWSARCPRPWPPRCGLPAGTPVVAGCGDTAASFLSCGATRAGVCVDVAGTASVFAATTAEFRADEKAMVLSCGRSAVPGLWHPYAYINGGGMNLEWFREQIAGGLRRRREPGAGFRRSSTRWPQR